MGAEALHGEQVHVAFHDCFGHIGLLQDKNTTVQEVRSKVVIKRSCRCSIEEESNGKLQGLRDHIRVKPTLIVFPSHVAAQELLQNLNFVDNCLRLRHALKRLEDIVQSQVGITSIVSNRTCQLTQHGLQHLAKAAGFFGGERADFQIIRSRRQAVCRSLQDGFERLGCVPYWRLSLKPRVWRARLPKLRNLVIGGMWREIDLFRAKISLLQRSCRFS